MAAENLTWGEERIANELWLKLQIRLSPRTVRKYIEQAPRPRGSKDQRWATFLRNHARGIVACDFFVSVTVRFHILCVFGCPRDRVQMFASLQCHPISSSEWTLQQLREALPGDQDYKFLLHDRHKTFSATLDETAESPGIHVFQSPVDPHSGPTGSACFQASYSVIFSFTRDHKPILGGLHHEYRWVEAA
jgi:putative transposase